MKKLISILVAFAMMATLAVSMAFAVEGESSTLATAKLTKVFDVPTGVAAPKANFRFKFTPDSANPSGPSSDVYYNVLSAAGSGTVTTDTTLETIIGFNDDTKTINITQPGEYLFTVSEVDIAQPNGVAAAVADTTYFIADTDNASTETVTCDKNAYNLRLYVINGANNAGLTIKAITVIDTDDDVADTATAEEKAARDAKKVSPETGFKFTNFYTKEINETQDSNGAFYIDKNVAGSAQTGNYPFTVEITIDEQTVANLEEGAKYTLTAGGVNWEFDANTKKVAKDVNINTATNLVFTKFPAGATVKITEKMQNSGIQNAALYTANATGSAITVTNTNADTKGSDLVSETGVYTAKSGVTVVNNLDSQDITPEGILISNLPYIALALVAIGGLVAYVVIRRRNADEA